MKLRHVYFLLFVLGIILPYSQFIPWFLKNGLDLPLFFTELFSTKIGGMFGMDLFVSAAVLFVFTVFEIARLKMRGVWLVLTTVFSATILAGVSAGFPLFLYLRQKHIDNL
jgi:Terpene cyclase DEP1